jgi:aryl sulfotransferase
MSGIIWLASYPKSGNTWLRLALQCLRRGDASLDINDAHGRPMISSSRALFDRTLNIESSDLTPEEVEAARPALYAQLAARIRGCPILKVHDAWTTTSGGAPIFPASASAGVIYLVRDPRDVAVSFSSHLGMPIDTLIAQMGDSRFSIALAQNTITNQVPQRLLTWSAHVESWLDTSGLPMMLVRYEDMIADMQAVLTRVATFAGIETDAASIAQAAVSVQFSTLREQEATRGFRERPTASPRFFRRGIAGAWRDELTSAQAERIVGQHAAVMRRLGYITDGRDLPGATAVAVEALAT